MAGSTQTKCDCSSVNFFGPKSILVIEISVKRPAYSALGYFIQRQREKRGLRRRRFARMIGFSEGKEGAAAIRLLEDCGDIEPPDLLLRVAAVLGIDEDTILQLQAKDRRAIGDWLRTVSEPCRPFLGINCRPMPSTVTLPEQVWGADAVEELRRISPGHIDWKFTRCFPGAFAWRLIGTVN